MERRESVREGYCIPVARPFIRWIIAIAFGLIATLGAAQDQTTPESQPEQQEATTYAESDGGEQQAASPDYSTVLESIEAAIRDLIAEEDEVAQEAEQSRNSRDLAAQEGMAKWAEWMFYATTATVILTALALWAIIRTLHHTRIAAAHAGNMVQPARESAAAAIDAAKAAIESNATMQRFGEMEVRAYLSVSDFAVTTTEIESQLGVSFLLNNSGNSPAYNVSSHYAVFSDERQYIGDQTKRINSHVTPFPLAAVIPPGASERVWFFVSTNKTFTSDFKPTDGEEPRQIEAVIPYQTIFDLDRDTFAGELSIRVDITDEIRNSLGTPAEHEPITTFSAYRSAWMNQAVETLSMSDSYRIFRQYVRPKSKQGKN